MNSDQSQIERVVALIKQAAPRVYALTGAGISTESGIPDFRSPGTGLWERVDPMEELSVTALRRNPQRFYTFGMAQFTRYRDAQPNQAHLVLAQMEEAGYLAGVVTQNIDGLHQAAGSRQVFEVHGHLRTCRCLDCGGEFPYAQIEQNVAQGIFPPQCVCGGTLRPNVVLFGDSMPKDYVLAVRALHNCDLLLVVGSSLEVSPANTLPNLARRVVIVNLTPTHFDQHADVVINDKASKVFMDIWARLIHQSC
ncbi:MAG: NAD-dependent deacylase [Firmicutes bacterium]|nr:NAD-dependent deacylase [Bacillota bacterium]